MTLVVASCSFSSDEKRESIFFNVFLSQRVSACFNAILLHDCFVRDDPDLWTSSHFSCFQCRLFALEIYITEGNNNNNNTIINDVPY